MYFLHVGISDIYLTIVALIDPKTAKACLEVHIRNDLIMLACYQ
jgi:hypothetical protein